MKYLILALIAFIAIQCVICGDNDNEELSFIERQMASNFFSKRFLHPFSTKCEEQKREVKERYEEKCEHIIPLKRNCPDIKLWLVGFKFKLYFFVSI
jgi:hypothetical protein